MVDDATREIVRPAYALTGDNMPISKYERYFGGKKGSASKAKSAMEDQYGEKKGKSVFYARINKLKSQRKGN